MSALHTPYQVSNPYIRRRSPGMGDAVTGYISQGAGAAAAIVGAAGVSTGAFLSSIGIASAASGPLAPFVIAAGALVALLGNVFSGCGQTCVQATSVANSVENVLKQNLAAWQSSQKLQSQQIAALANFDYAYGKLLSGCSDPSLGNAGKRCVIERLGTKDCANNPQYQQQASSLGTTCARFPWPDWYRDPIANDPNVIPDPVTPTSILDGTTPISSVFSNMTPAETELLFIAGGVLLLAMVL